MSIIKYWTRPMRRPLLGLIVTALIFPASQANGDFQDEKKSEKSIATAGPPDQVKKKTDDPLELAIEASFASKKVQSAIASGNYEMFVQEGTDKEPHLRVKAKIQMYYDRGRYHLHFDYQTKLSRTVYLDKDGVPVSERIVEWKPKDFFALYDGKDAYGVTFSEGVRRSGCKVDIYKDFPPAGTIRWKDPAHLGKELGDVDASIKILGRDAFRVEKMKNGNFRATYRAKNPPVRGAFEIAPEFGYNVVSWRVFNQGEDERGQARFATWKKIKDIWTVQRIVDEFGGNPKVRPEGWHFTRAVFQFDSFSPNVKVGSDLFDLKSLGIPPDARIQDQRPRGAGRIAPPP